MHVSDLADELGVSTVTIVALCDQLGIDARWAGAELSDEEAQRVRDSELPAGPAAPSFGSIAPGLQAYLGPDAAPAVERPSPDVSPGGSPPTIVPPSFGIRANTLPLAPPPSASSTSSASSPAYAGPASPPPTGWVGAGSPAPESAPGAWDGAAGAAVSARMAAVGSGSGGIGMRTAPDVDVPLRAGLPGHRDAMVASGWGYWWRSIGVAVATVVVVVFVALVLGDVAIIGAAYSQHAHASRGKVALVVFVFLAGLAWAASLQVRAAISSVDAWNRIGRSEGSIRGRGSTFFLVFSAVACCTNLAWLAVGGIWAIAAV